jgi:hypothetical protein
MIADFFTKPLQGRKFKLLRDIILNRDTTSDSQYRSVLGNSSINNIVNTEKVERQV